MLMSTAAFSTECSKKQIPVFSVQKQLWDQGRRQQYQTWCMRKRHFLALLFQNFQ